MNASFLNVLGHVRVITASSALVLRRSVHVVFCDKRSRALYYTGAGAVEYIICLGLAAMQRIALLI